MVDISNELRYGREQASIFSPFYSAYRRQRKKLADENRRLHAFGITSPVGGAQSLSDVGFSPKLAAYSILDPLLRGIDAPAAAAQGLIPKEDMTGEAFGTAGTAMLGGGAVAKPAGSLGSNMLRDAPLEGFEGYLSRVNPSGKRIAAEDRPNLMMGDMYGMLPRGSDIISERDGITFHRSPDGDYYATAYNPDVGEQDVVGYITDRGDSTELQVVAEMQGQGIGGELQYLFRSENPDAPTGGLTEAGERSLERTYDRLFDEGLVSANRSRAAGVLATIGDNGGPPLDKPLTKEQLDPLGYQKTKMRRPFSEVEVQQRDLGENLPRKPMNWEDMEGKVILPFYGDRTSRGLLVEGVNDYKFDAPVYTEGGVDFKVGPAAQKDRAIWASNQNIITRLSKEAEKAQRDFGGRDILGVTGSMAPDANDFATFTGEAVAELVKGSKITKKTAKEFDKTMKALDPTFVGLLSPDLRDWVKNTSSPNRKSFIRLMDSRPMQDAGLPSPAEARKSVTDPTQYELPAGMFGLGVSRIDTGAPLMFNTPKGNKPTARVPHSTYNTQITGDYLGSLRPVPQRLIFKDVYDAISGKLDKRGNPLTEANMTHAIKTKMPAQELTPQIIDGILNYLARLER